MNVVTILANHLEPWWRCTHPAAPMTLTMEIGYCGPCELERLTVAQAIAPVVVNTLADALPSLTEGSNREGTQRWPKEHRDVYSLAIEEAQTALRGMDGGAA